MAVSRLGRNDLASQKTSGATLLRCGVKAQPCHGPTGHGLSGYLSSRFHGTRSVPEGSMNEMFATAIVLLVLAAMANLGRLIYLFSSTDRSAALAPPFAYRVSSISFALGVAAFVFEKHLLACILFATCILAVLIFTVNASIPEQAKLIQRKLGYELSTLK